MVRKHIPCLLLATLTLLVVASCGNDPSDPGGTGGSPATLESIWPNSDGTEWHYAWKLRVYEEHDVVTYPTEDLVPEIPSWEDAYAVLTADDSGAPVSLGQQFYELAFSGRDTTASGATGQNLVEIIYSDRFPFGKAEVDWPTAFLARLSYQLPPLRSHIALPAGGKDIDFTILTLGPTLLHGGAFAKTSEFIGTYGDLDQDLAWKFLDADLTVGSEFTFQLAPSLADDIYLHGLVRRQFAFELNGVTYRNSLECLYLIDLGVRDAQYLPGGLEGFYRLFDVGTIVFAPHEGPVYSQERLSVNAGLDYPLGYYFSEVILLPTDLPDPDPGSPEPTLVNIWPNEDSNLWDYRVEAEFGDLPGTGFYDREEDVPPLPSLSELIDWLTEPLPLVDSLSSRIYMKLQFDGMRTTDSGVTAQNLTETFYNSLEDKSTAEAGDPQAVFLRRLSRARPDLRAAIAGRWPEHEMISAVTVQPFQDADPFFLFGYAWEKSDEYIGTYGDLDQNLAWIFLEADLSPGSSFSHQLVPALADDIWLHGHVRRQLDHSVGSKTYANCIELLYVVDLGIGSATDETGQTLGYWRSYGVGTMIYAPNVGPVALHERLKIPVDPILQDSGTDLEERSVELVQAELAP